MSVSKSYDLHDYAPETIQHIQDSLAFGELSILSASVTGKTLTVIAINESAISYVENMLAQLSRTSRKLKTKTLYERHAGQLYRGDIDRDLKDSGDLYEIGPGLVGLRGNVLRLYRFFEQKFKALAEHYEADDNIYPVMLPMHTLEETGYFMHFPQQITCCSHFPEDLPLLNDIVKTAGENQGHISSEHLAQVGHPRYALQPAVCLPCYGQFRNSTLDQDQLKTVTMQNHVFRYEGVNFTSLARLWNFSVRDIVFFGPYQHVVKARQRVMEDAFSLCEELDLDACMKLANDPFFLGETIDMSVYQRIGEVKYELNLTLPYSHSELSVSSFNLHRDIFSKAYNIKLPSGSLAETACMGFGIERWVYGFLSQKGIDSRNWDLPAGSGL